MVALFAWTGRDTLGPPLYALFLACLWISSSRRLYATMFVLSLAMELYGTWIGNWAWNAQVPWLGLAAANPAIAAGAFYCVLDRLVVAAATARNDADAFAPVAARMLRPGPVAAQPAARPGSKPRVASHQAATRSACSSSR